MSAPPGAAQGPGVPAWRTASVALTGCGFALAFGWLWFPVLREALLPGLVGDRMFRPLVCALALGLGCFGFGLVAPGLERMAGRRGISEVPVVFCVHALSLALLALAFPALAPNRMPEFLLALVAVFPGVWWTSRLLALGPVRAVFALAWAAMAALLLALPLAFFHAAPAGRPPASGVPAAQAASTVSFGALGAGLVLACVAALILVRRAPAQAPASEPPAFLPSAAFCFLPGEILFCLAALFFGLGSLNVFVPAHGGMGPAAAQVCGLALAGEMFRRQAQPRAARCAEKADRRSRADRSLLPGACGLALTAVCVPIIAQAFPVPAALVYGAGAGLVTATGMALCADRWSPEPCRAVPPALEAGAPGMSAPDQFRAGLLLILILGAVNAGYGAAQELAAEAGAFAVVPAALASTLPALGVFLKGRRTRRPGRVREEKERHPAADAMPSDADAKGPETGLCPLLAERLTEREQALALLLLRGFNNRAVAEHLKLAENTVRWYIKKLNKKTGSSGRAELIAALAGKEEFPPPTSSASDSARYAGLPASDS